MREIGKLGPQRDNTQFGYPLHRKKKTTKKGFTGVSLTFPYSETWSTISARVSGNICDEFVYDKNIYGEIFQGEWPPKNHLFSGLLENITCE